MSDQKSHDIDDHEKELLALAVKQLRDRCTLALAWLYPPTALQTAQDDVAPQDSVGESNG